MTSHQPRDPYTKEEIKKLYLDDLKLQLVQVFHRHGERTPTASRFENTGLPRFWPYCSIAQDMISQILDSDRSIVSQWIPFHWQRRIETIDKDGRAVLATGPDGDVDSLCKMGELTNRGRTTTFELGQRLRHLYVDQLKFLPKTLDSEEILYLRSSPIPRALESLQQVIRGLYPSSTRVLSLGHLSIITRNDIDENLVPGQYNCKRLFQLSTAFAQRSADRWNNTTEMEYLNTLLGKWMPEECKTIAVNSKPRLSGIYDTINSTLAHDLETRLPDEFYDSRGRTIIDKICLEEIFSGYQESEEYRALGIGSLMGDIVARMINNVKSSGQTESARSQGLAVSVDTGKREENTMKFALSSCHDTTLAAVLGSLGTLKNQAWPPYTSHIAFELFRKLPRRQTPPPVIHDRDINEISDNVKSSAGIRDDYLEKADRSHLARNTLQESGDNKKVPSLLQGYYVRLRYNDEIMTIPGCTKKGNHLEEDETFCTLDAFKSIVDKYVPLSLQNACQTNLDAPVFPEKPEPAGY